MIRAMNCFDCKQRPVIYASGNDNNIQIECRNGCTACWGLSKEEAISEWNYIQDEKQRNSTRE